MKLRHFLAVLFLAVLTAACEHCYPSKEPELKVIFHDSLSREIKPTFKRVYGLGGKGILTSKEGYYYVPVSLHADSSVYLFESTAKTDTLIVYYTRSIYFKSEKCGYVAEVNEDLSTREESSRTTFSSSQVTFSRNVLLGKVNIYEVKITL